MIYRDINDNLNLSKLHDNQKAFINSPYLHTGIVGGYQSGKSEVAIDKCIIHLVQHPGVPIAYYLPTYGLFEDMLIPKVEKNFPACGIEFYHNQKHSKIITPYGEIWMRSMDNPDRIVSYSVGYSVVDEVDVVHPNKRIDAMKRIASRNSYKKATPNQIDFVSTPEGFAYMYDFFVKKKNNNKLLLKLSTIANEENLAVGYIQGLREQYTESQLEAYLKGEFVNINGQNSYYSFDREFNHSDEQIKPHEPLYIGMDFNVGNMNAVVHVVRNNKPIAVEEIVKAYDTDQISGIIKERFHGHNIIIYPDASGRQRQTNADKTDIQILKSHNFLVKARSTNPFVSDRVKNMNRMFCNGKGERNYLVNTLKCPSYVESLEKLANDKNGVPDKNSGFDHITEAAGYFIYYEYPLNKKSIDISW